MPRGKKASNAKGSPRRKRAEKGQELAPPPADQPADATADPAEEPRPRKRRRTDAAADVVPEASPADASPEAVPTEQEASPSMSLEASPGSTPDSPPAVEQDPALARAEVELVHRYPTRRIVRGSLMPAGADPDFGHKRSVLIECEDCGRKRRLATSDLFHVGRCSDCAKRAKKASKGGAK